MDITDTTPAHTAATLRPDRHHTHGHQVAILGWRLYEAYRLCSFLSFTARPGRAVGKLRCWVHAPPMGACTQMLGVAWAWPGRAVDAQKGGGVVCASRRHQQVRVIERPARARRLAMPTAPVRSAMAIGSHGTGRGGTVGDGRHGRRRASAKFFSVLSVFVYTYKPRCPSPGGARPPGKSARSARESSSMAASSGRGGTQ